MTSQVSQVKASARGQKTSFANCSMTIESYLIRAQKFAKNQDYSSAIFELRQAIKFHPESPLCHSTLSVLYFQTKQNTMAGIHAKRTLALDPTNQLAIKIQQKLAKHKPDHVKRQQIKAAVKEGGIRSLLSKKLF